MEADYVIVGAGSAGCALASRLSEDGTRSVIVIEAGGSDRGPLIRMPGALSYPMNMKMYDWGFETEPEPGLGGRRLVCPRGRVIGGSSSINGMVYVRGHPGDYDHWAESGADGWGWADVSPYFDRMETWDPAGQGGDPDRRGRSGPLHVRRGPRDNPLHAAFTASAHEAGFPLTDDYNGAEPEGAGPFDMTVRNGERWSAADAYLRPALSRSNLTLTKAHAHRVIFDGRRATGVEVQRGGRTEVISAKSEVILAASAINSPRLLLLSGVGPGDELAAAGVPLVADRAGVGRNLQDHLEVYIQQAATQPVTLYKHWNLFGKGLVGLRWLLRREGPGASNQFESGAFLRTSPEVDYPDVQMHFLPIAVRYDGKAPAEGHGFQIHVGPMRSKSRGAVTLRGPDPAAPPVIRFNYMSHPDDFPEFRRAVRMAREVLAQPAFAPFRGRELNPGEHVQSDDELDGFIRDHAESAYHPSGSCRMGRADDPSAVVDPECRVIGVDGLRVVDSSIFPRITYGNLNAPSIMVGEKGADLILGKQPLPRDNRPRGTSSAS